MSPPEDLLRSLRRLAGVRVGKIPAVAYSLGNSRLLNGAYSLIYIFYIVFQACFGYNQKTVDSREIGLNGYLKSPSGSHPWRLLLF